MMRPRIGMTFALIASHPSSAGRPAATHRRVTIGLILVGLLAAPSAARASTDQNFDAPGTGSPYVSQRFDSGPGPAEMDGGPTGIGKHLRLGGAVPPTHNAIAFALTDPGAFAQIVLDFDLRMTPSGGRADGVGVAFLNTSHYGNSGGAFPGFPFVAEEPNFTGSVGIGFDIYKSNDLGDIGNENIGQAQSNSISVHYLDGVTGSVLSQFDVSQVTDLASGRWMHVRIIMRAGDASPNISVVLTPCGQPMTVIDRMPIPGLQPYQARIWIGGRAGGLASAQDIDNVRAVFSSGAQSVISFTEPVVRVMEDQGSVSLTLTRVGDLGTPATIDVATTGITATPGQDFTPAAGTVSFAPGEGVKTIVVQILNDGVAGTDKTFRVSLSNPGAGAATGGPSSAVVVIEDHERARQQGRWSSPLCLPIVPINAVMLPQAKLLYWDRLGNSQLWDTHTETSSPAAQPHPDYDMFCSGQSLRPDGSVLVTGGHNDPEGAPDHDGEGVKNASIYDPRLDSWSAAPDMNDGRWYPTNVPLSNGDTLVVSGSTNGQFGQNTLPQVFVDSSRSWRDLTMAQQQQHAAPAPGPQGVDLYPRMFSAGAQRAVKVGPDQQTWLLDATGAGAWSAGPLTSFDKPRTYGTAVAIGPGKFLVTGGAGGDIAKPGELPTATTEVIDLLQSVPAWQSLPPMAFARRQHNVTMLPDGNIFVAGGSGAAGFGAGAFDDHFQKLDAEPVYDGELWNRTTGTWTTMAKMRIPRLYHSTCLLLPDARVLCGGGGQGAGAASFQNNAEIYSPPYLFRGARPVIAQGPEEIAYGTPLFLATAEAQTVAKISLIRLAAVTHSFDQNQAFTFLDYDRQASGLLATAPSEPSFAPPGHYLLFIVNDDGVPSVGRIVRLATSASQLPGAPTGVSAIAGFESATVHFTPPANNGGVAITSYTVTSSPGGITAGGPGSPIRVTGLTNETAYTLRVTATNSAGSGPASTPSNSITPTTAFADVPAGHAFVTWIEALFAAGITGGCATAPAQYCPDAHVTRRQMAVFLLRGIHGAGYTPPTPSGIFADVALSDPLAAWIEQLFAEGITGGCATTPPRYCPDNTVTREQMAVFLLRSKHGAGYQPPAATGMFTDVPGTHPFAPWIEQLAREGVTGGCGTSPSRYCPDTPVTRGQMAVFLVRAFQLPL